MERPVLLEQVICKGPLDSNQCASLYVNYSIQTLEFKYGPTFNRRDMRILQKQAAQELTKTPISQSHTRFNSYQDPNLSVARPHISKSRAGSPFQPRQTMNISLPVATRASKNSRVKPIRYQPHLLQHPPMHLSVLRSLLSLFCMCKWRNQSALPRYDIKTRVKVLG